MADQKVTEEQLLKGLNDTFRRVGYDGASLSRLAEATGLKKASLYHRFPGGKKEMAQAVLQHASEWTKEHIVDVLTTNEDPVQRLDEVLSNIERLYSGGRDACILRALSQGEGLQLFQVQIKSSFDDWIKGFSKLAFDFGIPESETQKTAEDVLIKIQGSLVLSVGSNQPRIFKRTLKKIRAMFVD